MKIEDVFKRLKPVAGNDLDVLWLEYVLAESKSQRDIEDALRIALARDLGQTYEDNEVLLEPPPEELARGEYPMGVVFYGRERFHAFGMREKEWIQHLGIFGRSGCGKTNTAFIVVLNFLARGKPFLIFDWKRNYRDLLSLGLGQEILVFTVGREVSPFYFNPLIPPAGTPAAIWLKKLIEIMCHSYFLGEGVAYLLQKAIDSVYQEFGVYDGKSETYPTIRDVKDWLERYKSKGRESAWMDSALRAVGVLCFGETGRAVNQRQSYPLDELLSKNVILELDALTNSDKTFLIESLLLWIHHHRMAQGGRENFKHALIIEEAHHILLRKKQEIMGEEAVTDIILREIRELGEAIVLIDQHPSLISKPAMGNTYCTVSMNLKHRSDIAMIADSLLLDTKQARYLGKLETGVAMVKLQGRWFEPFLVRFPLVKVEKGTVTDDAAREMMGAWFSEREVFRVQKTISEEDFSRNEVLRVFRSTGKEDQKETEKPAKAEGLLLRDIMNERLSSTTDRYMRLGLNAYQGNKARQALIQKGLIEVKDMPTPTGRIKLLELTARGRKKAKSLGMDSALSCRKGGPEHEYWKGRIAGFFKAKGYQVIDEYPLGKGKTVDLLAVKDGEQIAIEIETGKSDAIYNIKKNLEAGFERVLCVVTEEKLKARINNHLNRLGMEIRSVSVFSPGEFLHGT